MLYLTLSCVENAQRDYLDSAIKPTNYRVEFDKAMLRDTMYLYRTARSMEQERRSTNR